MPRDDATTVVGRFRASRGAKITALLLVIAALSLLAVSYAVNAIGRGREPVDAGEFFTTSLACARCRARMEGSIAELCSGDTTGWRLSCPDDQTVGEECPRCSIVDANGDPVPAGRCGALSLSWECKLGSCASPACAHPSSL